MRFNADRIISFRTIITDSRPSGVGDVSIGFMPVNDTLVVNQTSASVMESHRHWIEVTRSVEALRSGVVGSNPTLLTNGLLTR